MYFAADMRSVRFCMIVVNCIGHSGFSVESETHMFLFDYSEGRLPVVSDKKKLYVFVSHAHEDHYNPDIFKLKNEHPRVKYILSDDVTRKDAAAYGIDNCITSYAGLDVKLESRFRLLALPSTDRGVAYLACLNGMNIFHAGDLNLWLWEGMNEREVYDMTVRFKKYTEKLRNFVIHTAFLPLDRRLGIYSFMGFDYYMKHFRIQHAIPMHFFASSKICEDLICDPISRDYKNKIIRMNMGSSVNIK